MPLGGATEETVTTGTCGGTDGREGLDASSRRERSGHVAEVGLGHHQHVGHLHDPRLEELEHVAGAGLHHYGDRVGHVLDVGLRLADADGLDHHHVERRGEGVHAPRAWRRPARPAGCRRRSSGSARRRHAGRARSAPGRRAARRPSAWRRDRRRARPRCARRCASARRAADSSDDLPAPGRSRDAHDLRRGLAAERGRRHLGEQRRARRAGRRGSRSR